MTEMETAFATLIERVMEGCPEATEQFHQEYGPHILRAVRRRLNPKLRSKFDSLDFVQDVWASFFRGAPARYSFNSPEALIAFLTTMARNKVTDVFRVRFQGQKYNEDRLDSRNQSPNHSIDQYPGSEKTPSEILMGQEAWDMFLAKQPLVYRRILILFREGRPVERIASDLGLSSKTIQRALKRALGEKKS